MIPSNVLRIALEGENESPEVQEEQQEQQVETPAEDVTHPESKPVPTDAERQAKLDAIQSQTHPEAKPEGKSVDKSEPKLETDPNEATAPAAGEVDGGETTVVDTATEPEQKKLKKEKELVFYGKLVSFNELKTKTAEYQEQYEVKIEKSDKNAVGGRIRVRKTVKGDKEPKYILTTKTKLPDGSEYESDCRTTEENFIQFKYFCEGGMIKDRYSFPVEGYKGLKWEIDVFTGTNGLFHEWVKIDLEMEDENIELANLPPFPVQLTDVITNQNGQRTPEEEAIVRTLYDTVFRTPNPIISKK